MRKIIFILLTSLIFILVSSCKSYMQQKWDDKKADIERTNRLNSEAKGSHVWYHERQTQEKYQKFTNQNIGTPNY